MMKMWRSNRIRETFLISSSVGRGSNSCAFPCRLVEEVEVVEVTPKPKFSSVVRLVSYYFK